MRGRSSAGRDACGPANADPAPGTTHGDSGSAPRAHGFAPPLPTPATEPRTPRWNGEAYHARDGPLCFALLTAATLLTAQAPTTEPADSPPRRSYGLCGWRKSRSRRSLRDGPARWCAGEPPEAALVLLFVQPTRSAMRRRSVFLPGSVYVPSSVEKAGGGPRYPVADLAFSLDAPVQLRIVFSETVG